MGFIFTIHAELRIKKRKLTKEEIIDTVKYPDITLKKYDKYYVQKKIKRGTIEVVYEKKEKFIRIITVYWL